MKDPHIHAEKTPLPGFGNAKMRELFTEALGVAPNMPKTVGTGCGKRRPIAMTSTVPEHVTCLACREYGEQIWRELADTADSLWRALDADPELAARTEIGRDELAAEAASARSMSRRYAGLKG